jgi:pimeloyl-ACP methyl ester carboxylesterase
LLVPWLLLVSGCRSLQHCDSPAAAARKPVIDSALLCRHVIEVNPEGFLVDLRPQANGRVIKTPEELSYYLQSTIFEGLRKSRMSRVLLFVHGGLNDRKEGLAHFTDDYGQIQGDYYPVFVVWPSGLKGTYLEHLLWVRQGIKAETFNEKAFSLSTAPLMLLADLGRAFTRLPMVIANNSKSDIETVVPIRSREGGAAVQQYKELVENGFGVAIGDDYSATLDRITRDTTYWATLPLKYVLASFVDGLGKGAWDNMLRRTQQVYPGRWTEQAVGWNQQAPSPARQAVGTRLSQTKRQQRQAQRYAAAALPMLMKILADHTNVDLTLIGHSMGTIVLNRVVRDAEVEFARIIYMGAACSVEDFSQSVMPYLEKHSQTQFYNLSLHPVAEAGEWYPWAADLPPRGSLLIWIDNFLSNPVTEQERTLGRWRNLFRSGPTGEPIIHRFFVQPGTNLEQRLHFRAFSVGLSDKLRELKYQWNDDPQHQNARQRCDTPLSHGDFTEVPYWTPEFWWPSPQPLKERR